MKRFILRVALVCTNALPAVCAAQGSQANDKVGYLQVLVVRPQTGENQEPESRVDHRDAAFELEAMRAQSAALSASPAAGNSEDSSDELEIAALAESLYGADAPSASAEASGLASASKLIPIQSYEPVIRIPALGSRGVLQRPNALQPLSERLHTYNALLQTILRNDKTAQRVLTRRLDLSGPSPAKAAYVKLLRHIGTYEAKRLKTKYQALTDALKGLSFDFRSRVFFPQQLSALHPRLQITQRILSEVDKALRTDYEILQQRLAECPWQKNGVAALIADYRFEIEDALEVRSEEERERALYQIVIPPTTVERPLFGLGDSWELTSAHDLTVYWAYRRLLVDLLSGTNSVSSTYQALAALRGVLAHLHSPFTASWPSA